MHLNVQGPQHMLQNCPIHTPEHQWSRTSYRTGLPIHLKVQGPQHILTKLLNPYTCTSKIPNISYATAQSMHLNIQWPQHILQNCPTHTPESPRSWTRHAQLPYHTPGSPGPPTHRIYQPYPYTWKSRAPNTPYIPALPIHLKVQSPEHVLHTNHTHTPASLGSPTHPTQGPRSWKFEVLNTSCTTALPIHLSVNDLEHILHSRPIHAPESPRSPTHPTELPYPYTWKSRVLNTSYRTALPIHLEVQGPQHILQNCPIHPPGSPGSWTHPTELPYPSTWKSRVLNTSYRTALPIHLEVQGPEHILHNCHTHAPESLGILNTSCRTALPIHLKVNDPQHILQNWCSHTPESPWSPTHPTKLAYPRSWKGATAVICGWLHGKAVWINRGLSELVGALSPVNHIGLYLGWSAEELVGWCFEPSQLHRLISGLINRRVS